MGEEADTAVSIMETHVGRSLGQPKWIERADTGAITAKFQDCVVVLEKLENCYLSPGRWP